MSNLVTMKNKAGQVVNVDESQVPSFTAREFVVVPAGEPEAVASAQPLKDAPSVSGLITMALEKEDGEPHVVHVDSAQVEAFKHRGYRITAAAQAKLDASPSVGVNAKFRVTRDGSEVFVDAQNIAVMIKDGFKLDPAEQIDDVPVEYRDEVRSKASSWMADVRRVIDETAAAEKAAEAEQTRKTVVVPPSENPAPAEAVTEPKPEPVTEPKPEPVTEPKSEAGKGAGAGKGRPATNRP